MLNHGAIAPQEKPKLRRTTVNTNPYKPSGAIPLNGKPNSANWRRWAAVGFAIAFIPFAAIGAYGLYADAEYAATLPPNTPRCGNGAMGAMLLIFPISPLLGCFGAGLGFVAAFVYNANPIGSLPKTEDDR